MDDLKSFQTIEVQLLSNQFELLVNMDKYDSKNLVSMAVGEMLTNIISTKITSIKDIKCSGNWMWANDNNKNKYLLYRAVCYLKKLLLKVFISREN